MSRNSQYLLALCAVILLSADLRAEVSFNGEIRPILSKNCTACHGPDDGDRKGDFRIDTFEGATHENDGVVGIVPGDPTRSEVIRRLTSRDPDEVMPPPEHGHALKEEEISLIKQWITEGAKYEAHWAFVKPVKSPVPTSDGAGWARNEIDHFVARKQEEMGLKHSDVADPHVLLRRVSLDLTGMPPSFDQVRDFAADPTPENYEKHVDALLASRLFGEHWAAMWLDQARYADSVGYSGDEHRDIWPWRDWVIDAFNKNMPFDRFTIEQLAGDLLPDATDDQKLATAFNRNTLSNNEGGTDDEEFRVIAVKDRVNTTVNVWMGLTMRCAECHTHKYDPISQQEYYAFYDFFNQTADSDKNDDRPRLEVYPRGREKETARLKLEIEDLEKKRSEMPDPWVTAIPEPSSRDGAKLTVLGDQSVEATGINGNHDLYTTSFKVAKGLLTGIRLELLPSEKSGGNIGRIGGGAVVITQVKFFSGKGSDGEQHKFSDAVADHEQPNHGVKNLILDEQEEKGWAMNHGRDGYRARREAVFSLAEPIPVEDGAEFTFTIDHKSPYQKMNTARYRISYTCAPEPVAKYRTNTLDPNERKIRELTKLCAPPIRVPVMEELPEKQRRESRIMVRGSFLQPGEKVGGAVLGSFNPMPEGAEMNRLGVAKWLVSRDNPLTSRVTVNRLWARIFGIGIVETEEDFGIQGTLPTHPELLDWLAVDFMERGWDVKAMLKKMVMSATYQQSARATAEQLEIDKRNLYLARGPRVRLAAEVIRDQALVVSGLMNDRSFGLPVYPPSPVKHIASAFTGGMHWVENTDADRYRRAIYTYLKRTSPHPLFETFDMASRDVCNLRRLRTNTPLQSFMTLNDPVFIEAAQALARKMFLQAGGDPEHAIRFGLETALNQPAETATVATLEKLYRETLVDYQKDAASARVMAGADQIHVSPEVTDGNAAELAALSVVANVILNLDGFLTN